ncbi:MAG: hypothetical protein KDL10_04025 [Kiritimatiellae bacterium]|nr:hypothetical protein [Kiritimatiellia bacterium]
MRLFDIRIVAVLIALTGPVWAGAYTGLTLSSPLLLSGTAGYRFGDDLAPGFKPIVEAEAGIGGGQLSVGLDSLGTGLGAAIKASMLRTWFEPIDLDPDQTYLGLQLLIGYDQLVAGVGGYRRIEGDDDEWLSMIILGFRL